MRVEVSEKISGYGSGFATADKTHKNTAGDGEFIEDIKQGFEAERESVVEQYKQRHPENAAHVDSQVRAGRRVLAKYGFEGVDRDQMSMNAYKTMIYSILDRIPFDVTRQYDREIISISEKGWEQMKGDADYEAWILGYTVENRSVPNPFSGWMGASGNLCIEKFGASIEEHMGQSMPMDRKPSAVPNGEKQESWWDKRHKRMKEQMAEDVRKARLRRAAHQEQERQKYWKESFESRQRMDDFFNMRAYEAGKRRTQGLSSQLFMTAVVAYDKNILDTSRKTGGKP